jgi:Na+-driven multidrug efflux pump
MYSSDLVHPVLYGLCDSLQPAIGYNWGAADYDRVKRIVSCAFVGTAVVAVISTSALFFLSDTIAVLFSGEDEVMLMRESAHGIRLFCFAYVFRWFVVTSQGFLSAIEKPVPAAMMSVSTAFVFPLLMLGLLWKMELDGIWLNFVGVNFLAAVLGVILLLRVAREVKRKMAEDVRGR